MIYSSSKLKFIWFLPILKKKDNSMAKLAVTISRPESRLVWQYHSLESSGE